MVQTLLTGDVYKARYETSKSNYKVLLLKDGVKMIDNVTEELNCELYCYNQTMIQQKKNSVTLRN